VFFFFEPFRVHITSKFSKFEEGHKKIQNLILISSPEKITKKAKNQKI
jgi:hypothetical protein